MSHIYRLTVFVMKSRAFSVSYIPRLTVFVMKSGELLVCLIYLDSLFLS